MSVFAHVEQVPGDPILGLTEAYNADPRPTKVNLGVGIYYDESGRIPLLKCVQRIERQLAEQGLPRGYLPIDGLPAYVQGTQRLLFGEDSPLLAAGRVATLQTIGGSGALRVGADLLKKLLPKARVACGSALRSSSAPTRSAPLPPTVWVVATRPAASSGESLPNSSSRVALV